MKMLGTLPSLRVSRNPVVAFGVFALVLLAAYYVADAVLANNIIGLAYLGLMFVAGVVVVAVLNDWRRGVYFFVAWLVFEDFVRKYLGNNMAIYFGKDLLVLLLYISFFRSRRREKHDYFRIPFRIPLLIFVWFGVLQMFNPASTSIFFGILGIKVYFLYVPLIFLGYAMVTSEEVLYRYFSFVCVLILIVAGLGIAQAIVGPTFLNPGSLQEDIRELSTAYRVAPISGLVAYRPTSVFVSGGRFQDFLIVAWLLSLGYGGFLLLRRRKGRGLAFTTIGVVAAASVMSSSRGVFMWNSGLALIWVAGFVWGAPWKNREAIRVLRAVARAVGFIFVAIVLLMTFFPRDIASRFAIYSETLMPDSPTSELVHRTQTYPLQQLGYAFDHPRWPVGYGIGTCTLGGQYVVKLMHAAPMRVGVESGFGNLIVELGILGLILWIILGLAISVSALRVVQKLRGTPWFPLAFTAFLFAFVLYLPMTYTSLSTSQDFVISANLWLLLGILYRIRLLPESIQTAQAMAVTNLPLTPSVK